MMRFSFLLAFTALTFIANANAYAYQEDYQVGDVVEFDFLGKTYQAEITDFTVTKWPIVKFEYRGRLTERFFPPSRLKLIESARDKSAGQTMSPPAEMRKWTDSTGSFSVNAKLVSNEDGSVKLEKEDGRIITLPLTKLSDKDQTYLEELKKQNSEANPFAGGEMKAEPPTSNNSPSKPAAPKIEPVSPNFKNNELVLSSNGNWTVQPDSASSTTQNQKVINFKSGFEKHGFHNRLSGVKLTNDSQMLVTAITNPFEKETELLIVDLKTATSKPPLRIDAKDQTLLAATENQAVTYKKGSGRTAGEISFWELGNEARQTAAWKAASFFDRDGLAPTFGQFIDENRLLTAGRRVILWNCESATAEYSFSISETTQPAISATGKQLAVASGKSVYIINIDNGEVLGKIEPPTAAKFMAFSPNGEQLAGINGSSGEIWIWNLSDNQLSQEFSAPPSMVKSINWVGEEYLLVDARFLIDVRLRAVVWTYESSGGSVINANGGRFWFAGKTKISPISLPGTNLSTQTESLKPEDLLVLGPDSKVSLEFNLPFNGDELDKIRDRITATLNKNGAVVQNNAELKLVFKIIKGEQEKAEMSSITDPFGSFGTESIKYTPQIGSVTLVKNGNSVCQKSRRFGPMGMIQLKRGETAQAAAKRLCKPDPSFFESIAIPKYIAQLPGGKPLGRSTISEKGIN